MKLNCRAVTVSVLLTIVFVTILTIAGEFSELFKGLLGSVTGHHWVTKSVFSVLFFTAVYFALTFLKETDEPYKDVKYVIITTITCSLIIFLFYLWHYIG